MVGFLLLAFELVMKNKKRFITLAITAIILTLLISEGYFAIRRHQNYQLEKVDIENQAREQKSALESAEEEIQKLKATSEIAQKRQYELEQSIKNEFQKSQSISVSASEISPFLTGVVQITCKDSSGSGSLWAIDSNKVVITNVHVMETPFYSSFNQQSYCAVWVRDLNDDFLSLYAVFPSSKWSWNSETDVAVMKLVENFYPDGKAYPPDFQLPSRHLNYKISSLKKCPVQVAVGSHVTIVGYPAFGMQSAYGGYGTSDARIVSNGIVSGYDKTVTPPLGPLPYPNYFVSAKIDSGNSGGIALAKTEEGMCLLGIPTSLIIGDYDTQGLIQNIHNIMYQPQ